MAIRRGILQTVISLALTPLVLGCQGMTSGQAYLNSIGGTPGATPTPAPTQDSGTPRSVTITWNASRAKDVGQAGGGYRVYVKKGLAPTTQDTTPVVVNNPGNGTHITSTTVTLTPGRHYFIITAFSATGSSVASTTSSVLVPQ